MIPFSKQKFHMHDYVYIKYDWHFHDEDGKHGIVLYTWEEAYGNEGAPLRNIYHLYIRNHGGSAWYHEEQLELRAPGVRDLRYEQWKEEHELSERLRSVRLQKV